MSEINERGNVVRHNFIEHGDRYRFDFNLCASTKGWTSFDTDQDAWYFGIWGHPERREIVTYAEGDVIQVECPTPESFAAEVAYMDACYGVAPAFTVIDAESGDVTKVYQDRTLMLTPQPSG
jgi:hypothetical protein